MDQPPSPPFSSGPEQRLSPYEKIKEAILDGTIKPGSPLIEAQVSEWCGVSRTPVREALTRLEQDGLVERSERGLVVRDRSPEEILDIYEVRIALEATAARIAAERHTSFDRIRLERSLRVTDDVDPADGDHMARSNREFHRSIWLASHSEALIDLLTRLNMHLIRYPATTLLHPGRWKEALREHAGIVEAVLARRATDAEELARAHFTRARDIRLALWRDDTY